MHNARAPPLPPSPVITETIGTRSRLLRMMISAIGVGLPARLRLGPGMCSGRVDERDHREGERLGVVEQPHRLAVALRVRHAEVAGDPLPDGVPLLVADHHDRAPADRGHPADDGGVVGEGAVAVQLEEVVERRVQVVQRRRAGR